MKPKICLLVSNDLNHDPRVQKQAETTAKAKLETLVLAWATGDNCPPLVEQRPGYLVKRGLFNPYMTPKLIGLNFRLVRFNLRILRNFFAHSIRVCIRYLIAVLRIIFVKIPRKIILVSKIQLKKTKDRYVLTRWIWNKIIKVRRRQLASSVLSKPAVPVSSSRIEPQIQELHQDSDASQDKFSFKSILIKTISLLNIYKFYKHYYSSLNQYLIEEGCKFKPDIVHANDLDTLWAGWQIKKKTGAKLVYDAHEIWTEQGLPYPKLINWLFKKMEKFLIGKVDHFITVNQSLSDELEKMYHFPKSTPKSIIYNCPRLIVTEPTKHDRKTIIALYQGRYSVNRGLEEIAQAGQYLNPNIEIHFRGLGDEKVLKNLKLIAQNSGRRNVKFFDPVEMDLLIEEAKTADIGLVAYIPSNINNKLCLPNKVYEYMMAGLALALSDLPELKRIVKAFHNGSTFNPYKPKDIAKQINALANRSKLNQMKLKSLAAAKVCNWEVEEKKLIKIYESLYAQKS